jgi:hypothetical protein
MFTRLRRYLARRKYATGTHLTRFLAPDVCRDVEVVDASEVDSGFITARIRTWNVLYASKGITGKPEPSASRRVAIADLWTWSGQPRGGPVPEDDA